MIRFDDNISQLAIFPIVTRKKFANPPNNTDNICQGK